MRIVSLTVQGFKSFGNRVSLEFAPGVTAIIGPNGSGKSNVIDALRWTTGGGRAREFRAADKTDLIFHGAAGKRSVGLAEVEVELHHDGRNVKVYRSLDRDGTTRLRLDGRAARFMDIDEALAGTGLGTSSLAIIGQGEVSQVLMADPGKLLEYVAEAAGVARLSTRRDQTQARLDTAKHHLDRLQDVLVELERRVSMLADEAKDARRYTDLEREALQLRVTAAIARQAALLGEIRELDARRGGLEAALAEGRARLADLRERSAAARLERDACEERFRAAAAELESRRGDLRVADERLVRLEERRASLRQQAQAGVAEAHRLQQQEPPTAPDRAVEDVEARASQVQQEHDQTKAALDRAVTEEHDARRRVERLRSLRTDAEREQAVLHSRRDEFDRRRARLEEQLAALAGEGPADDAERLAAELAAAAARRQEQEVALDRARIALAEVHRRQAMAAAEAMARGRAAERLRAAYEARRGYAQGPRNALASGIAGVLGSVADLVRVPERFQAAVAGALGRRAEYVVVDTAETAKRVLEHVRRAGGFVTVLPLDLLQGGGARGLGGLAGQPGVVAAAADVVTIDEAYRRVVEQLLGATVIVGSMEEATALARRHASRPRMVTLEGDILEPTGAMSGGKRSQHATVLGAAAELEDAEGAAEQAAGEAERALSELQTVQEQVRALQAALQEAITRADDAAHRLARAREEASGRERLQSELSAQLADVLRQRSALAEDRLDDGASLASAPGEDEVREAESAASAAGQALDAARTREVTARDALAAATHDHTMIRERWRVYREARERFEAGRARAAEVHAELGALRERLAGLDAELEQARAARDAAASAVPDGLGAEEEALATARAAQRELEDALTRETEAQAERAQGVEETKVQAARRETALELVDEELRAFPDGVATLDLSERAARARLRDVTSELEALGPVNHRAAVDLAEAQERKETLEVEAVQAALAVAELESTLVRIDRETSDRLGVALRRLQGAFGRHVQHLFGPEGRGSIEVETEAGRPMGVRIRLQPPGKQTQSLHLLSVGERTMGALAFLFALMADEAGAGGLPIAVLDEVDAPLDEANIRRFCTFVSRLATRGTQFVLITHQKATFEVADALWGVTTEQGVSRVFSVRREEAAAVAPA